MLKSFYKYEGDKMTTFIFGHKSPDTDTVCSSIALSYLKNELGDKTVPKVLGNINNETRFVLNYFNVPVPSYLNDVRVRIKNVKYDKKAFIDESRSIDEAFKLMEKHNITAIPLVDDKKVLTGYVTLKELAKYLINGNREQVYTTLDNIIETINAKVIVKCDDIIKGITLIAGLSFKALEQSFELSNEDILIVGDRYKVLDYAIKSKVKLVILPLNINLEKKIIKKGSMKKMKEEQRLMELEYDLICDFIKLRRGLGLTQANMATESGVVREMITVIESRKKHPQINTLIKILEPFGYTLGIKKIDHK